MERQLHLVVLVLIADFMLVDLMFLPGEAFLLEGKALQLIKNGRLDIGA